MANEKRHDLIERKTLAEELSSLSMMVTGLRAGKGVLKEFMEEYRKSVLRIVDEQATVDAVEVVHGRWIKHHSNRFECDCCNVHFITCRAKDWNYCPDCGADMRERNANETV